MDQYLPGRRRRPDATAAAIVAVIAAMATLVLPLTAQAASPDVVINEIYGGGGNSGAPFARDFVELNNRGSVPVSVAGWSIQYATASNTTWAVTTLSGAVQPGAKYLIRLGGGSSGGAALPTPNAAGSTNMSATSGKVALVTSIRALGCGSDCDTAAVVHDFVGYGRADDYETAPAPRASNTQSVARTTPGADTDSNAADFVRMAPSPESSAGGAGGAGGCAYPSLRIRDVQGAAHLSPRDGQSVSGVCGVVTARSGVGFWFQDPRPDRDPGTSEGLFVYTARAPSVIVGDEVAVTGTVTEYRSGYTGGADLTTTEITSPTVTTLGTGTVPAATVIGSGGRVPPTTVIDDDATGDVETSGTFDPVTDGIDFYESLEGMRVQLTNPVAVGPRSRFGEIPVLGDDGADAAVRTTRGGIVLRHGDANPERVLLDDAVLPGSTPAGVSVGDHFAAPAVGVLGYSFGNYKLELTQALRRVPGGLAAQTTTPAGPGQLAVATFNVENLDPSDPQSTFDGLARTIVTRLAAPGILVVEEIQDNDGPANSAVVDAGLTYTKLINAITAAGGPAYDYRQIDPVDDADGGEPGGNIRVGFLFRTDIGLSFVPGTPGGPSTAVSVSGSGDPSDPVALSHNPGRISPTAPAFTRSRKPLVGKFRFAGTPVFVIANHWNAKFGDDPLFGRYQPPVASSEARRTRQAQLVAGFVDRIRAIDPQARIVVAGDLNDAEYSAPVRTLIDAGLTDLPATLPVADRYTYVYQGNSQVLDHILLSAPLISAGYSYHIVHVNSEFPTPLSDHDPQVARLGS